MPFEFSSSLSLLLAGLLVHVVLAADGEIEIASVSFGVTSSGCLCSPDALLSEVASTCNGHSECTMYATSSQCDVDCGAATKTLKIDFRCSSDGPVMDGLVWTVTCAEGQGCLVSCERGSLGITVMSASYGLYHADCPRTQGTGLQVGWCKTETVLSAVKGKCDGSYTCSVAASPDAVCQGVDPCSGDSDHLVNTLSINYDAIGDTKIYLDSVILFPVTGEFSTRGNTNAPRVYFTLVGTSSSSIALQTAATGGVVTTSIGIIVGVVVIIAAALCIILTVVKGRKAVQLTGESREVSASEARATAADDEVVVRREENEVELSVKAMKEDDDEMEEKVTWIDKDGKTIPAPSEDEIAKGQVTIVGSWIQEQ